MLDRAVKRRKGQCERKQPGEYEHFVEHSKSLRRATLMQKVPYYTTMAGAEAAAQAIKALRAGNLEVRPLQSYF